MRSCRGAFQQPMGIAKLCLQFWALLDGLPIPGEDGPACDLARGKAKREQMLRKEQKKGRCQSLRERREKSKQAEGNERKKKERML